jgi:hypothetical protein
VEDIVPYNTAAMMNNRSDKKNKLKIDNTKEKSSSKTKTDTNEVNEITASRDVWNEAPTVQEQLYHNRRTTTTSHPYAAMTSSKPGSHTTTTSTNEKAIIRTTMGDIHIQLYINPQNGRKFYWTFSIGLL